MPDRTLNPLAPGLSQQQEAGSGDLSIRSKIRPNVVAAATLSVAQGAMAANVAAISEEQQVNTNG